VQRSPPAAAPAYPFDRAHSPIDAGVARRLREIAARDPTLNGDRFAKVGDSMTASDDFMRCFASPSLVLGEHAGLRPLIERLTPGEDSFRRRSKAARIGWSAWQVLEGTPSPVERELAETRARFALVQFGTNDLELGKMKHFVARLLDLTDFLIERGVIPILFTMPARKDRGDRGVWVPRYNAFVRAIARGRGVPLVDFHRELARLPGQGLAKDGIHPSTYSGPRGRDACALDAAGLRHGYNLRNLLALQALERAARALAGEALDPPPPARDPLQIAGLPYVDARRAAEPVANTCLRNDAAAANGLVYRFTLAQATALRATIFARAADTALALARSGPAPDCLAAGRESLALSLGAGSYELTATASSVSSPAAPELFLTALSE
jgi:hypothetical protein